jgi:hypothetical protein
LTIRISSASQLKTMPDMRPMFGKAPAGGHDDHAAPAANQPAGKFDLLQVLERCRPRRSTT